MTKENSGWISVEDRLPEDNQSVIVYVKKYSNTPFNKVEPAIYRKDESEFEGFIYYFDSDEITHWQPLPEPPK